MATLIAEGNDTVLKPLTWQGDMGLGPARDGEATFLALDGVPGWGGLPDLDEAGPTVVGAYVGTHGPTTPERVHDWFGKGLGAKRKDVTRWLARVEERLETVTIEGERRSWCSVRTSTTYGRRRPPPRSGCCPAETPG